LLYLFEDYALDTDRRELRRGAALLSMEPQVFDLLAFLVGNRDRVVSKDDLLASVWGGRIVSESTLATRINAARRIVGDSGEQQRLIRTTIGKGVRFVGAVQERQAAAEPAISFERLIKGSTMIERRVGSIRSWNFSPMEAGDGNCALTQLRGCVLDA